jgi:hypothetical protein
MASVNRRSKLIVPSFKSNGVFLFNEKISHVVLLIKVRDRKVKICEFDADEENESRVGVRSVSPESANKIFLSYIMEMGYRVHPIQNLTDLVHGSPDVWQRVLKLVDGLYNKTKDVDDVSEFFDEYKKRLDEDKEEPIKMFVFSQYNLIPTTINIPDCLTVGFS